MAQCTAPVEGHRTASGAANCPACRGSYGRGRSYYSPPVYRTTYTSDGGGASVGGGQLVGGSSRSYTSAQRRTLDPVRREVLRQVQLYPERRDLFLCHAWNDRQGCAKKLHDLLEALHISVWFSEKDVPLGTSLLTQIDKGLRNSRAGIVLVTPHMLTSLLAEGIAEKELSALLATDRVIPVAHGTTFDALRDVSPLLAARSGLNTAESSLAEVAAMVADAVKVEAVGGNDLSLRTSRAW